MKYHRARSLMRTAEQRSDEKHPRCDHLVVIFEQSKFMRYLKVVLQSCTAADDVEQEQHDPPPYASFSTHIYVDSYESAGCTLGNQGSERTQTRRMKEEKSIEI